MKKYRIKSNGCEFIVQEKVQEGLFSFWKRTKVYHFGRRPGWSRSEKPVFNTIEEARGLVKIKQFEDNLKQEKEKEKLLKECRKAGMKVVEEIK